MPATDLLLPEGTRLVHIGPHKTGTTALQSALHLGRSAMAEHGVIYAQRVRQHQQAALAVTGGRSLLGDPPATPGHWQRLVRDVAAEGGRRVIVSSEFFDDADSDAARRVVTELGGPNVHILVTLRPLTKILPSAWQQYVRNKLRTSYDDWLRAMFERPPYVQPTPTFWARQHHDVIVERWASVVGPGNLTVVVADDSDRMLLMRSVEALVGLPTGLLKPEEGYTNRSLTYGEIELVRALNAEFKRQDWPDELYRRYVREGVVAHLLESRQPTRDEAGITTPMWVLERAAEIGAAAADKISALGVRIVGDISSLGAVPPSADSEGGRPKAVLPSGAAMQAVVAVMAASGAVDPLADPWRAVTAKELSTVVLQRALRRTLRSRQKLRRRLRRRLLPGRARKQRSSGGDE